MKRTFYLGLLTIFLVSSVHAFSKVGSRGALFLKIGVGARAFALGDAFVAMGSGPELAYWNPGKLSFLKQTGVAFSHYNWFAGIKYEYISAVMPFGLYGALGLQLGYLNYGSIPVTTIQDPDNSSGDTYGAHDAVIGVTYSRRFTDKFGFGITFKGVFQSIWDMSSKGMALDLGSYYETGWKNLVLGLSLQNFGTSMKFSGKNLETTMVDPAWADSFGWNGEPLPVSIITEDYDMPLMFRLGLSMKVTPDLSVAMDLIHPSDGLEKLCFGAEYSLKNLLALRLGYIYDMDRTQFDTLDSILEGFSAGFGLKKVYIGRTISIDYGLRNYGRLSFVHVLSLNVGM